MWGRHLGNTAVTPSLVTKRTICTPQHGTRGTPPWPQSTPCCPLFIALVTSNALWLPSVPFIPHAAPHSFVPQVLSDPHAPLSPILHPHCPHESTVPCRDVSTSRLSPNELSLSPSHSAEPSPFPKHSIFTVAPHSPWASLTHNCSRSQLSSCPFSL